ncbi:MAG: biotin/lipoyl-binding protein [Acidobacteria bacterium]|jgi:biotin carboxyl carrier protein|nr:biotin/lipoyl-binding protein [Acidobacteriota bacterium]
MREYVMAVGGKEFHAGIKELTADYALVQVDDMEYRVVLKQLGSGQSVFSGLARSAPAAAAAAPAAVSVAAPAKEAAPVMTPPPQSAAGGQEGSSAIPAPLPGLVLDVLVKEGDAVKAGQSLLVMEAMKMENQIQAPFDGTVKKVFVQKGANISEGDKLIEISRPFMTTL